MDKDYNNQIARQLEESAGIKRDIARNQTGEIARVAQAIIAAYKAGGKVVFFGNGGSAADAQHLAGEMVGKLLLNRKAFPAIALNTNSSILTALANDFGYDSVFARQVEALVNKGDVVIGISTSGNSPNVIEGLKAARVKGARTVGFSGNGGGKLKDAADMVITVPSDSTPRIQEAHITIGHIVCGLVEAELAGK
ncbi:MAG: D-sedoheptulose 7-phosphate isomerase [Dehalococcoidales bacterium]|nr:D-sedoheptulose 7-phosphate isomerase [Dehalococcoidales bacterium]